MSAQWINSIGLGLDIVGVVMIFFFGLAPDVQRGGAIVLHLEQEDASEARKAKIFDCLSWVALLLLISGFGLQIYSDWM